METHPIQDPPEPESLHFEGEALRPELKLKLALNFVAVILFVLSLFGVWGLLEVSEEGASDGSFYFSLFLTVAPLLLLAFVLVLETRISEKLRLGSGFETRISQLQNRLAYREDMLRLVSDHQPSAIYVFDRHNRYWFVNEKAATQIGKTVNQIIGQPPIRVLPDEKAEQLELRLAQARASDAPVRLIDRVVLGSGETRFIQRHYEVVSEVAEISGCIMLREDDLTDLIVERERREQMLRQVIDTLVAVVDRRDPYASGHSSRVGQLARAIAIEMGLPETEVEATEIAGSLMNFGKVLVSRRILTKTSALSPDELQRVRDSILTSSEILGIIGFDGPVVPTLRQVQERVDGQGTPDGLKGEDILLTARIVAVANAYVAFVSPRAHRDGLPFKDALACMNKEAGKAYDGRVLIALAHYIENRPDKLDWLKVKKPS